MATVSSLVGFQKKMIRIPIHSRNPGVSVTIKAELTLDRIKGHADLVSQFIDNGSHIDKKYRF